MGFFDGIGNASNIVTLIDYISKKIISPDADYKDFLLAIRKIIKAVCQEYRNMIDECAEFRDVFFHADYEDLLFEAVKDAIEANVPFTPEMVLPKEDINLSEKKRLYDLIMSKLSMSFEYTVRENLSEIHDIHDEIVVLHKQADKMLSILTKILTYEKKDSAEENDCVPQSWSQFHYSALNTNFSGRNYELQQLKAFCGYNSDMRLKEEPRTSFSWWLVTGEGGSGKSRLCFEFAKLMKDNGWSI